MRLELVQPLLIVDVPLRHGDRRERPCFLVVVPALEEEDAQVRVDALISVPLFDEIASGQLRDALSYVWYDLELRGQLLAGLLGLESVDYRVLKVNVSILRARALHLPALTNIHPVYGGSEQVYQGVLMLILYY